MQTEEIMGIPVDNITYKTILEELPDYFITDKKMTVVSVNPQIIVEGQKFPEIIKFIKKCTHRIPDGIGVVLVSKLTGGEIKERITGYDLMLHFLDYADIHKKNVFFYGAEKNVLSDMTKNISKDYPNLKIVGQIDGYTDMLEEEIVKKINTSAPDFLFVALGFPKQEQWLSRNVQKLDVSVFQDVGGSFDVLSGHVKRAPDFFIKYHSEWLYRSISNPRRVGRIFQLPIFVVKSLLWYRRKK